jgi:hypothetical protein
MFQYELEEVCRDNVAEREVAASDDQLAHWADMLRQKRSA